MRITFAPLEGITGYIYRNTYQEYYGGIDRYYSPFLVTRDRGIMKKKELRDILPENNLNIDLVPQLLTNKTENFLQAAAQLKELGYREINLNLGCPSGTVVSKGRGAGFLDQPEKLQSFLEEIFQKADYAISIKTRIGMYEPEEFHRLLAIYNEYPICELIIHPRTRQEFYKEKIHPEIFKYAYEHSKNPITFNGEIRSLQAVTALEKYNDRKRLDRKTRLYHASGRWQSDREQNTFEKEIKRVFRLSVRRISGSDVCGYSCII